MKPVATPKKPALTATEWKRLIASAPGKDRTLTPSEAQNTAQAVVVKGGGYAAVGEALAKKRERGERGPQVAPTKQLVSVRYSPEVLQYFKASGAGWQTRVDEALLEWVHKHPSSGGSGG